MFTISRSSKYIGYMILVGKRIRALVTTQKMMTNMLLKKWTLELTQPQYLVREVRIEVQNLEIISNTMTTQKWKCASDTINGCIFNWARDWVVCTWARKKFFTAIKSPPFQGEWLKRTFYFIKKCIVMNHDNLICPARYLGLPMVSKNGIKYHRVHALFQTVIFSACDYITHFFSFPSCQLCNAILSICDPDNP